MLAVKDNKTPLIDRLIDLGADVCARNNVSTVSLLQQRKANNSLSLIKSSQSLHGQ